jgi:hypothetical protein
MSARHRRPRPRATRRTPASQPRGAAGAARVAAPAAWWVRARRRWLLLAAGVALVATVGAALGASGLALVRHPADFSIYYAAARVLAAGGNPYDWHALQRVTPVVVAPGYVYPLWGLFLFLPLAWLPLPVAAGIWLMTNLACLILALTLIARLAALPARSYWLPALLLLACLSIPGLFAIIQGQLALVLLATVVAAFWATQRGRGVWAGGLVALSLVKPQLTWLPALVILALAWRRGIARPVVSTAGACLAALVCASFALRPNWLAGWASALQQDAGQGGAGTRALHANMGTIPALAEHLPAPLGAAALCAALAAGAGLLAWQGWRALRPAVEDDTLAPLALLAVAICVGTALSPWMWIYDGVFWLVPVVLAVARGPAWRRWTCAAVFWGMPWCIRLVHVAAAGGAGTSLNKLEDVLVAPLLLALVLLPALPIRRPAAASARAPIPVFAWLLPTRPGRRT